MCTCKLSYCLCYKFSFWVTLGISVLMYLDLSSHIPLLLIQSHFYVCLCVAKVNLKELESDWVISTVKRYLQVPFITFYCSSIADIWFLSFRLEQAETFRKWTVVVFKAVWHLVRCGKNLHVHERILGSLQHCFLPGSMSAWELLIQKTVPSQ